MSKLSRIETGHGVAAPWDIRDLGELYQATGEAASRAGVIPDRLDVTAGRIPPASCSDLAQTLAR